MPRAGIASGQAVRRVFEQKETKDTKETKETKHSKGKQERC
jgi:hypothetical protein